MRMILYVRDLLLRLADWLSPWLIPTLARIVFAGVLLVYYWNSAATKVGDGIFGIIFPSVGAYAQILPS